MPGPYPWGDFLLMLWPVWLLLAAVAVLGFIDWHASRPPRDNPGGRAWGPW